MTEVLLVVLLILVAVGVLLGLAQYRATGGEPIWAVEALDGSFVVVKRNVIAPDEETVRALLRQQGLRLDSISLIPMWRRMIRRDVHMSDFRKVVPARQISDMAQTVASFLEASVPIQEAIAAYSQQKPDNMCREVMRRVRADLSGGRLTVTEAFEARSEQLGPEVVAIINAGMTSDRGIQGAFTQIAEMAEKRAAITQQWRSAMIYPAIVLLITLAALALMLWKVVPTFQSAYKQFHTNLPFITQWTVDVSKALFTHFYVPVLLVIGVIIVLTWLRANEKTRLIWDRYEMKLPMIGRVIEGSALGRAMATLSSLLAVGVPTQEALRTSTMAAGNKWIEKILTDVANDLGSQNIQEAVKLHADELPASLVSFVETGAATADLDSVLSRYARFAQRDADVAIKSLSTSIEPAMLIIIGSIVGFIVIAMYLPMINLVKVIH
jgi:type IV pilus assembly protein PilC